ncbi:unnamed protein product [Amoebophrya sp. A120]|nr:unnamed protein product [Amoebophrya sp. A120]|eukprot:GSA120T00009063001.1
MGGGLSNNREEDQNRAVPTSPSSRRSRRGSNQHRAAAHHALQQVVRFGGGPPSPNRQRGTHWCHECNQAVNLNEQGLCNSCGGGFVEEGTMLLQETPPMPLLNALQAVHHLAQMQRGQAAGNSTNAAAGDEEEEGGNSLGGRRGHPRIQVGEMRIEVLLRELQNHLRAAESMRTAMRDLLEEEDVVATTAYGNNSGTPSNIDPLKATQWDSIETRLVSTQAECDAFLKGSAATDSLDDGHTCAICCGELFEDGEPVTLCKLPRCQHVFHKDCCAEWFQRASSCPICRSDLNVVSTPGEQNANNTENDTPNKNCVENEMAQRASSRQNSGTSSGENNYSSSNSAPAGAGSLTGGAPSRPSTTSTTLINSSSPLPTTAAISRQAVVPSVPLPPPLFGQLPATPSSSSAVNDTSGGGAGPSASPKGLTLPTRPVLRPIGTTTGGSSSGDVFVGVTSTSTARPVPEED